MILISKDHSYYSFQKIHAADMQELIWNKSQLSGWNTGGLWTSNGFIYSL